MSNPIIEVLEYKSYRQYFGKWSPKQISDAYHQSTKSEKTRSFCINTDKISVDDICDSLWNEMSYNPIRFGQKSPFIFNGINSIQKFCNCNFKEKRPECAVILLKIQKLLIKFLEQIDEFDPSFKTKRETDCDSMFIGTQNEYVQTPNKEYEILKLLRECIKEICLQNVTDYKDWSQKDQEKAANISSIIIQRHPNFVRPIKIINYSLIERIPQIGPAIEKTSKEVDSLRTSVSSKTEEVYDTQMKIDSLQDYEEPADTSHEEQILQQRNHELDLLQSKLDEKLRIVNILKSQKTKFDHTK